MVAIVNSTLDLDMSWISAMGRAVKVLCFPKEGVSRSGRQPMAQYPAWKEELLSTFLEFARE